MSLRIFYTKIDHNEVIQQIFFILNLTCVEKEDCLVCYEQINDSENVICHQCKKPMHLLCIEKWFDTNKQRFCPHCRTTWKFEIDIVEKVCSKYIELGEYSIVPNYKKNYLTVRGSIRG